MLEILAPVCRSVVLLSVISVLDSTGTVTLKTEHMSAWDDAVQAHVVQRMGANPGDAGIEAPQKVKHVAPEYPRAAIKAGTEGTVTMEARVDTQGKVAEVVAVKGEPQLAQAVEKAVRKWRYRPLKVDGKACELRLTVEVVFSLRDDAAARLF